MERITNFNLTNDDFNIDDTCGIRYIVKVDLTITDLLEIAPSMLVDILLNNTDFDVDSVENDNYISFNKYGGNEYNFDFECCNEIKKRYTAKNNNPVEYTIELCNLTPESYESLPDKIKEALPSTIEYERPTFTFRKPEVKVITQFSENKRKNIEGDYRFQGQNVHYKDMYAWCNLNRNKFKDYVSPHKKFYWEPQNNKFSAQFTDIETVQQVIDDIATNGIRTELRFEVNNHGQLSSVIESGQRFVAAMFLGLPTIPACLIYRQHLTIPFMGSKCEQQEQNPELINFLNEIYYPDLIFKLNSEYFHNDNNGTTEFYDKTLLEIKNLMCNDFPNKIYCKNSDLPVEYKKMNKIWNL